MFGFLVLNKPSRLSSRAALNMVVRSCWPVKVGHAGTLDPLARGVLVACLGPATRLVPYVQDMPKSYVASFRLGVESETEDLDGELVPIDDAPVIGRELMEQILPSFVGNILQCPPKFSALKVNGKRAHRLARKGRQFDLDARKVLVHSMELTKFEYPDFELQIVCGSGTYVRSLGRDIGRALGSGAVMTSLLRTAVGPFRFEDSLLLTGNDLAGNRALVEKHLLCPRAILAGEGQLPIYPLSDSQVEDIGHGRKLALPEGRGSESRDYMAVDSVGRLMGILYRKPGGEKLSTRINFHPHWNGPANISERESETLREKSIE